MMDIVGKEYPDAIGRYLQGRTTNRKPDILRRLEDWKRWVR